MKQHAAASDPWRYVPAAARSSSAKMAARSSFAKMAGSLLGWTLVVGPGLHLAPLLAREPTADFVAVLQQQGEFALAHQYLERLAQSDLLTTEQKDELGYFEGTLLLAEAEREMRPSQQKELSNRALASLREFLRRLPAHARASSAHLRLAELELWQARQVAQASGGDPARRAEAVEKLTTAKASFQAAQALIKERMLELPRALDPQRDAQKFQQRRQWEAEYLQTLLSQAITDLEAADMEATVETRQQRLDNALSQFQEIAKKYRLRLEAAAARLYIAQCYLQQRQPDQALGYLTELLDARSTNPGVVQLQTKALPLAMECWLNDEPPKWSTVVRYGENWLNNVGKNIPRDDQALRIQLQLAQAYRGQAQTVSGPDVKRWRREARRLAQRVVQTANPYQADARRLLEQLGGDLSQEAPTEGPELTWQEPTDATAALQMARQGLTQLDELDLPLAASDRTSKAPSPEVEQLRSLIRRALDRAIDLADSPPPRQEARALLAYWYMRGGQPLEAAILATHVMQAHPDSQAARDAGPIALSAWAQAHQESPPPLQESVQHKLLETAEFLAKNWSGHEVAQRGTLVVIKILARQGNLAEAEQWLARLDGPSIYRRDAQIYLGQSLLELSQKQPASPTTEAQSKKGIAWLEEAWSTMRQEPATADSVRTVLVMAAAQQKVDPVAAEALLRDPVHGPLTLWDQRSPLLQQHPQLAATTCQLALRGAIQQLQAKSSPENMARCVALLQQVVALPQDPSQSSESRLSLYASLCQQAGTLLAQLSPQQQQELGATLVDALRTFVTEDQSPANLAWISTALQQLVGPLAEHNTKGEPPAVIRDGYTLAISADERVLAQLDHATTDSSDNDSPQYQVPRMQAGQRLALAHRALGDYAGAIQALNGVLQRAPHYINLQVLAAETYQQWGDQGDADQYRRAIEGNATRPGETPAIWGWSKIAAATTRSDQHRDIMLDARLHLAQCRRGLAKAQQGEERQTLLRAAKSNLLATPKLVPAAAQEPWRSQFDALLREIQTDLGEPATGLNAAPTKHAAVGTP